MLQELSAASHLSRIPLSPGSEQCRQQWASSFPSNSCFIADELLGAVGTVLWSSPHVYTHTHSFHFICNADALFLRFGETGICFNGFNWATACSQFPVALITVFQLSSSKLYPPRWIFSFPVLGQSIQVTFDFFLLRSFFSLWLFFVLFLTRHMWDNCAHRNSFQST